MRAFKRVLDVVLPLLLTAALFVYIKEWNPFHKEGQNSFTETADGIIADARAWNTPIHVPKDSLMICHSMV